VRRAAIACKFFPFLRLILFMYFMPAIRYIHLIIEYTSPLLEIVEQDNIISFCQFNINCTLYLHSPFWRRRWLLKTLANNFAKLPTILCRTWKSNTNLKFNSVLSCLARSFQLAYCFLRW
jgi:hypothetical protein